MLPRIGIPWYKAKIKQSVFAEASSPRGFNFNTKMPKEIPKTIPIPELEPVLVTQPVTSPVPSPVTSPVPKPVNNPVTSPVPNPVTEPVTKPVNNPVTEPVTNPSTKPKLWDIPPLPQKEKETEKNRQAIPSYVTMLERQKQSQLQQINDRHREMVKYDMLMQRDIAQRKIVNQNAKFSIKTLEGYKLYMELENASPYEKLTMSKETRIGQIKAFNEKSKDIEKQLGGGKDIVLDYISNNEITFATLPHHYKEINKEVAKAGVQGLALGALAYILYQIAKVGLMAI